MGKTKLTEEDIINIINLYQTELSSTHRLAEKFKVGHKKISQILKENNIVINNKGGKIKMGNTSTIMNEKIKILKPSNGFKLVAKCKTTDTIIDDPNNLSGSLTNHIIKTYGDVKIPTNTYQRKKYEIENGKKWYEEYFDIVEIIEEVKIKKETTDKKEERRKFLSNPKNYVICNLCGEKMEIISNSHLSRKHNITPIEYKLLYPKQKTTSENLASTFSKYAIIGNTNMKPTWTSKCEIEIKNFIEGLGFEVEKNRNRYILNGKEIDLMIPEIKLAIEYNGLYYHTERMGKHSRYHLNKTTECNKVGYKLIHIFEDEWLNNKELVKNKLTHLCGRNTNQLIGARKCKIISITQKEKNEFLDKHHIQGRDKSIISIGAFYGDELVAVMTFDNKRNMSNKSDGKSYELTRFATNINYRIPGIGDKLLKYFVREHLPSSIISFGDVRWVLDANNNFYTKLGFKLVNVLRPNYRYYNSKIHKHKRLHKFGFGKNNLKKRYPDLDFSKTEKQLMTELGYDRIWDCGLFKYELKLNN
jgi:hypothetical protein